jgi:hypothetical protein
VPGRGFGLFRAGQSLERGFRPVAVFPSLWIAQVTVAMLPGTGRDPMLRLAKDADAEGFPVVLDTGDVVGHFEFFDERLMDALNVGIHLLQAPLSLADFLDAAGAETLGCCGAILDERHPAPEADTPE